MKEDIKKFEELLKTDEAFQKKLVDATQAYNGDTTPEAIFNNVLVPVASEYGITSTYDELKDYLEGLASVQELNEDEMEQVAGGSKDSSTAYGAGMTFCLYAGLGLGATADGKGDVGVCVGLGGGAPTGGGMGMCAGIGAQGTP